MNIEKKTDNTINKITDTDTDTATVEPLTTEEDSPSEDGNYINKLLTTTSSTGFGNKYKNNKTKKIFCIMMSFKEKESD
ncbi:hypothetical protein A0H76_2260 [Hepatospora eriocheir]|uniref:Uncharacterized protein n=1 Tax=Hepatospora eriocheir TaxID=1081669 RepID=A0A1X0QK37_9MICR|nr:hypothetical protein A0H76_2260 [Hepatospora eriocheir]